MSIEARLPILTLPCRLENTLTLLYFTDMIVITMLQMEGQEIELDNDQRVLSYYSIDPGDVIQVKI